MHIRVCTMMLIVPVACLLGGCGDDDKGTGSKTSSFDQLVATWTFQSAYVNGVSVPLENVIPWQPNTVSARITVGSDSTYVYENVAADGSVLLTENGTFAVDGDNFSMTDNPELPISGKWSVSGHQLTLTSGMIGYIVEIMATK